MKIPPEKIQKLHSLLEKMIDEKLSLSPIKSITKIQDEVHQDNIFKLFRTSECKYIAINIADESKIETPRGGWLFVVTAEDPHNVIMISQDRINKILISPSFMGTTGVGHTSLSRKYIALDDKFRNGAYIKERMKTANRFNRKATHYALDVYLAGEILFNDSGEMIEWNNNSGHYRISKETAIVNIPSPIKNTLPKNLFKQHNNIL